MNELKARGVADVLIAVVDGLKGFPEAINAAVVQPASSMGTASTSSPGRTARPWCPSCARSTAPILDAFEAGPWGAKCPAVAPAWRRNWDRVIPFFAFPEAVRRIIYTTNAIEALNSKLRRAVRARGHFPSDEAATKLLYLVLNRAAADWKRPPREWVEARTQFAITFGERFRVS